MDKGVKVPAPTRKILNVTQVLATAPSRPDAGHRDIHKEIYATQTAAMETTARLAESGSRGRCYADALRRGVPDHAHPRCDHALSNTPDAAQSEISRNRDVIVKLVDAEGVAHFRTMESSEIKASGLVVLIQLS
ncbi:hypothetical protein N7461_006162 [Penicillium sp. DV-2018c]|nr:hypothetical protein N7461_006162 [Penicillium sp. DV-2018c]